MLIYSFINYPFVIMCSKRSENIIGGDKLSKRARNVLPLEKKLDVLNRLGRGESAASVARLMACLLYTSDFKACITQSN